MSWSPDDEGTLAGWWRAEDLAAGAQVSWPASGLTGVDLDEVGGTPEVGLVTTANGSAMVTFTAADSDYLANLGLSIAQPYTIITYARVDTTAERALLTPAEASNIIYAQRATSGAYRFRISSQIDVAVTTDADDHPWILVADGASSFLQVGGDSVSGSLGTTALDALGLGTNRADGAGTFASCSIAEVAVFSARLSALSASAADIVEYFTFKYEADRFTPATVDVELEAGGVSARAPVVAPSGGWGSLISVLEERVVERRRPVEWVACPYDGTPLRVGPDGGLFCPSDGWRPTWDA